MAVRYPAPPETDQLVSYRRYAAQLRSIRESDPIVLGADADLMAFDAEAMMDLMTDSNGYHFYESRGDSLPPVAQPGTEEATELLKQCLALTNQSHPYAQHLIIHSTEMSNVEAETAIQVAAHLARQMAPLQAQHLQHMTTHTFLRTGFYHEAVVNNAIAVHSDATFLQHDVLPYGPGHNSVFLIAAAMWGGERAIAYRYANVMQGIFQAAPGRPDGPNGQMAWGYPMVVALRFGDWSRVAELDVAPPGNFSAAWPYGYGVNRHFSRAIASLRLGNKTAAEAEAQALKRLLPEVEAQSVKLFNLTRIANMTVTAALAHARGDLATALDAMSQAVAQEMAMPYSEPPPQLLPTRECYGRLLLEAGQVKEAEAVFRAALYGFSFHAEPRCGWALFGLQVALEAQQHVDPTEERAQEIQNLTQTISVAWRFADVLLETSCHLFGNFTLSAPPRRRFAVSHEAKLEG
uniref:Tetratricopeptide repeat protein 38 n=1 Tax=Pyrodinium bahamense TaxID=73915 RepID=A0A7S0A0H6_9DINO